MARGVGLTGPGGHMMQQKYKRSTFFILSFDLWPQEQDLQRCWRHLTWSDGGEQQDHRSRKRDQDGHVDAVDQKSHPLTEGALRKRRTTAETFLITSNCGDYSNKTGARENGKRRAGSIHSLSFGRQQQLEFLCPIKVQMFHIHEPKKKKPGREYLSTLWMQMLQILFLIKQLKEQMEEENKSEGCVS